MTEVIASPAGVRVDDSQAEHLRRFAADRSPGRAVTVASRAAAPRTLVLVGAKGGVGVSTLAHAMALDLAEAFQGGGARVLAVHAHNGRDDLAVLHRRAGDRAGLAVTTGEKLGVAPPGAGDPIPPLAQRLLRTAARWTDEESGWVVVDGGVACDRWTTELCRSAARPLVVTTPDELALVNAYAALKQLGNAAARVGLVVNRCDSAEEALAVHHRVADSCRRFLGVAPTLAGWSSVASDDAPRIELSLPAAA